MRKLITLPLCGMAGLVVAACAGGAGTPTVIYPPGTGPESAAAMDSVRQSYSEADVAFMTGMIHHHAQALVMARMAPTHGASPQIRTLTARIINGQRDEIAIMQRWLEDRDLPFPEVDVTDTPMEPGAIHAMHDAMHGGSAHADMAGMLSPDQLAALDAARGEEFDRLFLTYMIQHHKGALVMVDELFASHGGGLGDAIYKIASDIGVDQATEIKRMQDILAELLFGSGGTP